MSLLLNGTSQYLWSASQIAPTDNCTLVARFKTAATAGTLVGSGRSTDSAPLQNLILGQGTAQRVGAQRRGNSGGAAYVANTSSNYALNTWILAMAVFSAADSRTIYADSAAGVSETTSIGATTLNRTSIGALLRDSAAIYLAGRIAHVGIWTGALSANDRAALICGFPVATVNPANLLADLPLLVDTADSKGNTWTNNATATIDSDNPTISSMTIDITGLVLTITTATAITLGAGGGEGLTLSLSGGACTATYSAGSGTTTLTYDLSRVVTMDETGTATYTNPTTGWTVGGTDVGTVTDHPIVNDSNEVNDEVSYFSPIGPLDDF